MSGKTFGRRAAPVARAMAAQHTPEFGGSGGSGAQAPWTGDPSGPACQSAAAELARSLPVWMTYDGRIHAETYVAAAGAIAGFAAQCTFLAGPRNASDLTHIVTTRAGRKFLFSDALNGMLLARLGAQMAGRAWNVALAAAVASGMPFEQTPEPDHMFAHVAATLGGDREGFPSVGTEHYPHQPGRALLKQVWPRVQQMFEARFEEAHRRFEPTPRRWWGPVAAYGGGRAIIDVRDMLAPRIALTIFMETAIYASKLHPEDL